MKNYLINNNCLYSEAKSELKNTENAFIIKMTSMRARCLSYIIEHAHDGVIEKQQLTAALWGSRGQYVSDANLTQILYLIRRDLKTMGVNDFFITIPRLGIKVNDSIPVDVIVEEKLPIARLPFWKRLSFTVALICISAVVSVLDIAHFFN
nr:hypothetical protein [uncultured Enterobacter sp.]